MQELLFALWFFAPASWANMAPIFANNIPALKHLTQPLDFGKTFRGKRIFGSHKTFRGLLSGTTMGFIIALVQMLLYNNSSWVRSFADQIDYSQPRVLLIGIALGFGALAGDAIKSFFKRQVGIKPGHGWPPFDQTDFIIGGLVFSAPFVSFSWTTYVIILTASALLHPVTNIIGWMLHLKSKPF